MLKSFTTKYKYPILLALVVLLTYAPFYIKSGFLGDFGDPIGQTIPNKFLLVEYLKNGIAPLWNPFSFLGMPFLADIQVGTFYFPDIIIFSIFKPLQAHNISVLAHLIFAAIGFFLLQQKLGINKKAAFASSSIFVLTGSFLTKLVFLNFLATIAYLPWLILVSIHKKRPTLKISLITGLMIFAGHPVAAFYVLLTTAIFAFIYFNKNWKKIAKIYLSMALGVLISAIQLLPFWNLKINSVRDTLTFLEFIGGTLTFREFFGFLDPSKTNIFYHWDRYIHFGTIAFLVLVISPFFYKKFSKKIKKIYLVGVVLAIIGIFLSTMGFHYRIAKILYQIPIINLTRVSARYIVIFHFGAAISIACFLTYLFHKRKKTAYALSILIILNSIFVTNIYLDRYEFAEANEHYKLNVNLEQIGEKEFSIDSPPEYFLTTSSFLFPNRHLLKLMPNFIGYNPLMLKTFHDQFPVAPVGAFENPDYFSDLYEKFTEYGLKYYIFPTEKFLKENDLVHKTSVIGFLENKGWTVTGINENYQLWENPNPTPFAYFQNPENTIESINFKPGKIILKTKMQSPDTLIINQNYYPGWQLATASATDTIAAELHNNLVQSYKIPTTETDLEIAFKPKDLYCGFYLSLIAVVFLIGQQIYFSKK